MALEDQAPKNPAQAIEIHVFGHGDEILKEGETTPCFFVILRGKVRISRQGRTIRVLQDQDVFGLDTLVLKMPSSYTASSVETSRIAVYGPEALDHFIRKNPRMVQRILTSVLRQLNQTGYNLTGEPDPFSLEEYRLRFFKDGETVLQEGTVGKEFFRLVSTQGGLRVLVRGNEVGRIHKPGEFIGEMAGLMGRPYPFTVTSVGESVLESYTHEDLDGIAWYYPDKASLMIRALLGEVREESSTVEPTTGKG
ncbi:MAG: cyclic nucleotide-binding domain-containing protein [Syntrophobacteraceae bacterium]|nr:cyclic nucleotide-binding domain-containing protein [Syntrophobacteraceae bacterium]